MNASENLLSAARSIEEALPLIDERNVAETLKEIANRLCFLSALYALRNEVETQPVNSNVIAFVKRGTTEGEPT